MPTGRGENDRFGAGVALGFALHLREPDLLGVKVRRLHYGGVSRAMTGALAFYRWRVPADDVRGLFFGVQAGLGVFTGCVESGACGGLGASLAAELGLALPVADRLKLEFAFEPVAQVGMPGGAGVLLTPTFVLGLAVW